MKNLLTKIQNAESNEERDMLTYIFNKEAARSLGKTLSEFGVDWSKLDVDGDRRYNCEMDAVVTQHLTSTATMFMDLTHDLSKMRRQFKKQTEFGLSAIQQKQVNPNQKLANKIQTRPAMNWWTTVDKGKMVLYAEIRVCPVTNKVARKDQSYDANGDYIYPTQVEFNIPILWHKQITAAGGVPCIDNKIILRAKPIGMFGDVEGFRVTVARKGLKATDWVKENCYLGKFNNTVKLCKNRMHIQSVAKRKASSQFTDELLSAFD